ncbi:MAG: hypothetical protein OHK0039_00010 [Bacteroidia bacterium]
MKGNYMLQGYLSILLAALLVLLVRQISGDSTPGLDQIPGWSATDSLSAVQAETPPDTVLHGEEAWEHWEEAGPQALDTTRGPLDRFFAALERLRKDKTRKVRIGYFGDSMIEGDLVTQSLRNDLQARYGGEGVGFVPIVSHTYSFRKSIRHRFSSDWRDFSFLHIQQPSHPFGISGEFFLTSRPGSASKSWVSYEGVDLYAGTQTFQQVRLLYGPPGQPVKIAPSVQVETDSGTTTAPLPAGQLINTLLLADKPTTEVRCGFNIPGDMPIYGFSFESPSGVFVDNFSSRGNSGMNLIEIPGEVLAQFQQHMQYDLIVLHFGLNVVAPQRRSFASYERAMIRVVDHFRTHMPGADILIVSVGDKSTRIGGVMQTDPSVPLIVEAQRRVADERHTGFVDLYRGMGGRNAMIRWVEGDPSLANNDYTHPNRAGAERVSNIVRQHILQGVQLPEGELSLRK